ncbi:LuxR C-terminal-related transcriptional regulator [Streptomyces sp. NPDC057838]|uniref:helix-turn-helix domain-containing protein n=1 Tax=unclassified Streptomyces TaxID=2593676 RepID=UPI003675EEFB
MTLAETMCPPLSRPTPDDRPDGPDRQAVLTHQGAWEAAMARVPVLSDRELDVFRLLAKGASNRTISARLAITERTAKAHVAQILAKLEVESRLQAGIVGFAWEVLHEGCCGEAAHSAARSPHPRPWAVTGLGPVAPGRPPAGDAAQPRAVTPP